MRRSHWTTGAAVAALCLLSLPAAAGADTAGTLFEQPVFSPGSIHDQDGWLKTGAYDAAVVANSGSAAVAFGQQSLRISNATTSGAFADQTFSAPLTDGAGEPTSADGGQAGGERQPHHDTTFRFLSTTPAAEQPGLAITVSPDSGTGGRMSFVRLRDTPTGISIDFVDVPSAQTEAGHVDFREVEIARSLDRTVPHSVRISIDFVPGDGNDVVKVYVDDQLRGTGASWENYYRHDLENGPANTVPVIDQLLLRASSVAHPELQGKGFLVDDVSSRSYGGLGGATGPAGPPGPVSPAGTPGINGSIAPTGQAGPAGPTGTSGTLRDAPVPVQIRSARLNRRTGVATIRLRCPAKAGLCNGSISLTNARGALVRRTYDLASLESGTLRIRFATSRRTATVLKRPTVRMTVFSRDQSGQAVRVQRTLR